MPPIKILTVLGPLGSWDPPIHRGAALSRAWGQLLGAEGHLKGRAPPKRYCLYAREANVHSKGTKKGIFLPAMKGPKARKTRANMHVNGIKEAKSSFRMVINPFRFEREQKKKLRKIHPKMQPI